MQSPFPVKLTWHVKYFPKCRQTVKSLVVYRKLKGSFHVLVIPVPTRSLGEQFFSPGKYVTDARPWWHRKSPPRAVLCAQKIYFHRVSQDNGVRDERLCGS